MPIRYCNATSKRTGQPCRARAMRGMDVCYHHGGASLRGFVHPNYKHGYYCHPQPLTLAVAFAAYQQQVQRQQFDAIMEELKSTMPTETAADYGRFMAACRAAAAKLPPIRLTPAMERVVAAVMDRWSEEPGKTNIEKT